MKAARFSADSLAERELVLGLFGQDHLSAEVLVLGSQGAEVDPAGTTAPLGVLSIPDEVVVARLLLAVGQRGHQLARDVVEFHADSGRWGLYRIAPRSNAAGTVPNGGTRRRVADCQSGSRRIREGVGESRKLGQIEAARESGGCNSVPGVKGRSELRVLSPKSPKQADPDE